jgi:hypothetical protein
MKETAIQWLLEELNNGRHLTDELIEQAKEKETQQIIDAVEWNYKSNMGEVYYNATYKNNKL